MRMAMAVAAAIFLATSLAQATEAPDDSQQLQSAIIYGNIATIHGLAKADPAVVNKPFIARGKPSWWDKYPPLHYELAIKPKIEVVKALLEAGAEVDLVGPPGTPLHVAAGGADIDIVKLLLEKGANVNGKTAAPRETPLQAALMRGKDGTEIAKLLMDKGAKIDAFSAAGLGKMDVLKKLIEEDPKAVTTPNDGGRTPLHFAARNGQMDAAKLLLENKADPNAKRPQKENSMFRQRSVIPLHLAAIADDIEMAKLLIERKADVEGVDEVADTSIFFAKGPKMVEVLVKAGAKLEAVNDWGETPLMLAITLDNKAALEALLAAKADPNAGKGECKIVLPCGPAKLRDDPPANPGGKTTALHIAADLGRTNLIEPLIKAGAVVNMKDINGHTPLDIAGLGKHKEAADILRKRGGTATPPKQEKEQQEDEVGI